MGKGENNWLVIQSEENSFSCSSQLDGMEISLRYCDVNPMDCSPRLISITVFGDRNANSIKHCICLFEVTAFGSIEVKLRKLLNGRCGPKAIISSLAEYDFILICLISSPETIYKLI